MHGGLPYTLRVRTLSVCARQDRTCLTTGLSIMISSSNVSMAMACLAFCSVVWAASIWSFFRGSQSAFGAHGSISATVSSLDMSQTETFPSSSPVYRVKFPSPASYTGSTQLTGAELSRDCMFTKRVSTWFRNRCCGPVGACTDHTATFPPKSADTSNAKGSTNARAVMSTLCPKRHLSVRSRSYSRTAMTQSGDPVAMSPRCRLNAMHEMSSLCTFSALRHTLGVCSDSSCTTMERSHETVMMFLSPVQ
mmetsp:Transcript_100313/g.284168  ORF Transcript_100313/g.284168 Transcript_100313/m.284168 type:complete len:250 (-) Transcript_100313:2629-3378(-)